MKKAPAPKVPKGFKRCDWQGYGFGASYEDAGCVNGRASDLDNCEHKRGGVLIAIGEEDCPNCQGKGVVPANQPTRGVMALIRQRECRELCGDIRDLCQDPEDAVEVCQNVERLFRLLMKREEGI